MKIKKLILRGVCTVIPVIMILVSLSLPTFAASSNTAMLSEIRVSDIRRSQYEKIPITSNGVKLDSYLINSTTYVPVRAFYNSFVSSKISYTSSTRTVYVSNGAFNAEIKDKNYFVVANGRYLWSDNPIVILDDGRMYAPVRLLARTLGVNVGWDNSTRSVKVYGKVAYIKNGSTFYDKDSVYWLSRIISAESMGEPLLGQIAVGNVVLNRVRSGAYPNSIYGVIFDRRYGIQFTPVANGTIYNTPSARSVIAAKICLEGTTLSDDLLFFFNAKTSTSSWIARSRTCAFVIGNHKFCY